MILRLFQLSLSLLVLLLLLRSTRIVFLLGGLYTIESSQHLSWSQSIIIFLIIIIITLVSRIATGWTVQESNPGRAEFPAPVPGAHPASYALGNSTLPATKQLGRGVNHPPPSSAEVKERVVLYFYSTSGPSWQVTESNLPFYMFSPSGVTVENLIYI
jgi:hypothetical protein